MTYLVPVAPPVPVPSTEPAPAILAVAEALQPDLAQGFQIEALRLRVLIDGKPAAGIKVAADENEEGVLSDADGVVSVLPQAGFNKLWAGQRRAVSGDPRFTTVSVEYILAFDAEAPR